MAIDFLLLQRYPGPSQPRFRHYGWHRPAFTLGYSQKIEAIRTLCPREDAPVELCRRFTGGGLVEHRDDWTYALVIPHGHALEKARAVDSYRAVHEALAGALRAQGQPAETKQPCAADPAGEPSPSAAGVCFRKAECYDVVHPLDGTKIAGAAQKRNKHGLILQGSLWRPAAARVRDWDAFQSTFTEALGVALEANPTPTPWPELNEDEVSHLTETYASAEWTERR